MLVSQSKRKSLYSFVPWTSTILNFFDGPKPKTSHPKGFARFISQMKLVKTNKMSSVWQS